MRKRRNALIVLLLAASMLITAPVVPAAAVDQNDNTADQEVQMQDDAEEVLEPEESTNDAEKENDEELKSQEEESTEKATEPRTQAEPKSDTKTDTATEKDSDTSVTSDEIPQGAGTVEDPYQIGTKEELIWFAGLVNGTLEDGTGQRTDACAMLTEDIIFNEDIQNPEAEEEEWIPIGNTENNAFSGYFFGDDHTIKGLFTKEEPTEAGLFGFLQSAHVRDLTVADSKFYGYNVGGIAGFAGGETEIKNCYSKSVQINAYENAGGIIGRIENSSKLLNCQSEATQVNAEKTAGGIAGYVDFASKISECRNTGTVGGDECYYAGGIAGENYGKIAVCTNEGDVNCTKICRNDSWLEHDNQTSAGGIVGYNAGIIGMTCNKGNVTAVEINRNSEQDENGTALGGVVGLQNIWISDDPMLMYSYNVGTIGENCDVTAAGGVIGYNQFGFIIGSYNYGKVMEADDTECMAGAIAGYMGLPDGEGAYNCYYMTGTSEGAFGKEETVQKPIPMSTLSEEKLEYPRVWNRYPEEKSQEAFASGEVAWLMNMEADTFVGDQAWYQRLSGEGINSYPVLEHDKNGIVYADTTQKCPNAPKVTVGYNNTKDTNNILGSHDYHDAVPCSYCGSFIENSELPKNEEGYYEIDSADDLYWFAAKVNGMHNLSDDGRINAVLTADITVNENLLSEDGTLNGDAGDFRIWEPIGYMTKSSGPYKYRGIFEGNGHTISGLYQPADLYTEDGEKYTVGGLFGVLYADAKVMDVKVVDSYFEGSDGWSACGGIAGCVTPLEVNMLQEKSSDKELNDLSEMRSQAHIADCEFEGVVKAYNSGGIVGAVRLTDPYLIFGCMNYGSVFSTGTDYSASPDDYENYPVAAGGICGCLNSMATTTIAICGNEGDIHGTNRVGGIVGASFPEGKIELAGVYNLGTIQGQENVGGLAGEIYDGFIYTTYNAGTIESGSENTTGGIVGAVDYRLKGEEVYYDNKVYTGNAVGAYLGDSTEELLPECGFSTGQFADGQICKALNASMLDGYTVGVWYQTLGQDTYPTFDSSRDKMKVTVTVTSRIIDGDGSTVATVSGGGIYDQGEEITVRAPEVPGFKFLGWFDAEDTQYEYLFGENLAEAFFVPTDMNLVAVYEANENADVIVKGTGFQVNGEESASEGGYSGSFRLGETITLEYTGTQEFLYWKSENGNILSKSIKYSFTLIGNTTVMPVCADNSAEKSALVEFVSDYGQVIQADTYKADAKISFPEAPSLMGGTFQWWSIDGETEITPEQITTMIENGEKHITLRPVYQMSENKFTISVITVVDGEQKDTVQYENIQEGTLYTVKASKIEGKNFLYWSKNNNGEGILSYSEHYAVKVSKNITLYAIYEDEQWDPIEKYPTVTITEATSLIEGDSKKLRFISSYDVPEGYEIQETGVIYSTKEDYGLTDADNVFKIGADQVKQAAAAEKHNFGTFTLTLVVGDQVDVTAYVRGYLIVKNKNTGVYETIYSEISSGSYNSLD